MNIIRVATLVCFMMAPTFGWAGFVMDRQSWNALNDSTKLGYVMGLIDQFILVRQDDHREMTYTKAIMACISGMDFTNDDLVVVLNKQYEDLENWNYIASVALRKGLNKVCKVEY